MMSPRGKPNSQNKKTNNGNNNKRRVDIEKKSDNLGNIVLHFENSLDIINENYLEKTGEEEVMEKNKISYFDRLSKG